MKHSLFGLACLSLCLSISIFLSESESLLRFPRDLGKRALSATACGRRNASSRQLKGPRVGLSWKGRCSACPLVANFFSRAGGFGDPIPNVYRCPQTSPFQHFTFILFYFNSQACPCLQQVCDPLIH